MVGNSGVVRAVDAMEQTATSQCTFRPEISEPVPLFCVASNLKGTMLACAGYPASASSSASTLAFWRREEARSVAFGRVDDFIVVLSCEY